MVLREPLVLDERQDTVKEISSRRDGGVPDSEWGDGDIEEQTAGRGMQKKCMRGCFLCMDIYLYEQEACYRTNPQM